MARINEFTPLKDVIEVMVESNPLRGKVFCITGHLGRVRSEIEEIIRHCGGTVTDRVAFGTTHLLTNADWNKGALGEGGKGKVSSKFAKAKQYNVAIINEAQFYEMITAAGDV